MAEQQATVLCVELWTAYPGGLGAGESRNG